MLPRERVIQVIAHKKPDRIPVGAWLRANLKERISEAFGSVEALEDKYEFDLAHIIGHGVAPYDKENVLWPAIESGGPLTPERLLDLPMTDPDDMTRYGEVVRQILHHKERCGRFVYVQTPGVFECNNGAFGIENHLAFMALCPEALRGVYRRQAAWNRTFALNCLDLGVDMIHVSDDWGAQNSLMFSPKAWRGLIFPFHKEVADAVKARGAYLSLHSDGNVNAVVDGIVEIGYDVVHPWQESAGMSLDAFKSRYRSAFTVMGGLDVQTALGFGRLDSLKAEIERVMRMFADGGLIFCTTHYVQAHCSMEELIFALDLARGLAGSVCR